MQDKTKPEKEWEKKKDTLRNFLKSVPKLASPKILNAPLYSILIWRAIAKNKLRGIITSGTSGGDLYWNKVKVLSL